MANDTFIVDISYWSAADAASQEYVKYTYDSNDAFFIAGEAVTYAQFDLNYNAAYEIQDANGVLSTPDELYDGTNNGELDVAASTGYASEYRLVD